jgi:hypothetical protein
LPLAKRRLENRRPQGYAGSTPVPSAISFQLGVFIPTHTFSSSREMVILTADFSSAKALDKASMARLIGSRIIGQVSCGYGNRFVAQI